MNTMQIFNFENSDVRTHVINDEPWFVGKDVAEVLGYSNTRDALNKHVDDEDKNTVAIHDGTSGNPNQTIINESGLYSLVFKSQLPSAKRFKRWVTSEVIPAIRKHGAYTMQSDPMHALRLMFHATEQTQEKIKEVDDRVVRLEENIKLEPGEYAFVGKLISAKVYQVGRERAYSMNKQQISELFKAINREIAEITGVRTRTQLRQKDYEKVISFIDDWEPSKATSLLVRAYEQIEIEV